MEYYCLSEHRPIYIYTILPIIVCFINYVIFAIYYKVEHKTEFKEAFCHTINQSKFMILILTAIISLILIWGDFMLKAFNDSKWWFTENTRISKKIGDWGDFATCLSAIFALISILLAYKAFISQVNASRRASFDATFTQIFAQHKILYDKAMQHNEKILFDSYYDTKRIKGNVNNNVFLICKNEYISYIKCVKYITYTKFAEYFKYNEKIYNISNFWENFNKQIGTSASVDFKNYLKYIHNEVEFVANQPDYILDDDTKQRYIQLIQAQMNNDELFCYLINKVEFMERYKPNLEEGTKIHAKHLEKFKFFIELCRGRSGHVVLVRYLLYYNKCLTTSLIDEKWFTLKGL